MVLTYTPAEGFRGEDSFVYTIDGQSKATVTVAVHDEDQTPISGFESTGEFRDFILEKAIQRYGYQFGTQDYGSYPDYEVVSRTHIEGNPVGMYLSGDRVTVISQSTPEIDYPVYGYPSDGYLADSFITSVDVGRSIYPGPPQPSSTFVTVIDVADHAAPEVISHTQFDGQFEDSRRIEDQIFLILKSDAVLPELLSHCDYT